MTEAGEELFDENNKPIIYKNIKKYNTDIWGLKYLPSLEDTCGNDVDTIRDLMKTIKPKKYSNRAIPIIDFEIFTAIILARRDVKSILEIGIQKRSTNIFSSSKAFILSKDPECIYLGIDLNNKRFLDNPNKYVYTLQEDSSKINVIRDYMLKIGMNKIDLLMIDGCHSVNMAINDWKYTEYLSDEGIVVLHDTNVHPGPYVLFDAIDDDLFIKRKFYVGRDDSYGIGLIIKK